MRRPAPCPLAALFGTALLALSACNGDPAAGDAVPTDRDGAKTAAPTAPARKPTPAASATGTATTGTPDLNAYVGKYPFDKIDGIAFDEHPLVRAGIAATVKDRRIRTAIADTPGPAAPIETIDGKIASWACQQHKCGEHQWMVLVDPKTGATDVCYMNDPAMVDDARWFLANGREEKRDGDCASKKR